MGHLEVETLEAKALADLPAAFEGARIIPHRLAAFDRYEVESEPEVVPGLTRLGVGDDASPSGAALREKFGLALHVAIGRGDQNLDPLLLAGADEALAEARDMRVEIRDIARVDHQLSPTGVLIRK